MKQRVIRLITSFLFDMNERRVGGFALFLPIKANFCTAFMPDSEQIEAFGTEFLCRNSVSVEEIQDRCENRKFIIGKSIFSI